MSAHVLEMFVKMQTGDAITGLDIIENKLTSMADQILNFKPMNLADKSQVKAFEEIQDALKTTAQLTGLVTDRNLEGYLTSRKQLELAVEQAQHMENMGASINGSSAAMARLTRMDDRRLTYLKKADVLITDNNDLITKIVKGHVRINDLNKTQQGTVKQIAKILESIRDSGDEIGKKYAEQIKNVDKLKGSIADIEQKTTDWKKVLESIGSKVSGIVPGLAQFAAVASPLKMFGDALNNVNDMYEKNHTVNNVFLADAKNGISMTTALAKAQLGAAHDGVLMSEAGSAINAILAVGTPALINNSEALSKYAHTLAVSARATGINESVLADLIVRTDAYSDSIGNATKLTDVFVNTMAENRLTTSQMSKIAGILQKDLMGLNSAFAVLDKRGNIVASGSEAITIEMGRIAKAAKDAGGSADAAMDLMTAAIERPLSVAALLQGSLTSSSISEQFDVMGKNAEKFAAQMKRLPPALQGVFAQKIGTTRDALLSTAAASAKLTEQAKVAALAINKNADASDIAAMRIKLHDKAMLDAKNTATAKAATDLAAANAARRMAEAFDNVRKVFAELAIAFQPILEGMAGFLVKIFNYPWASVGLVIGGAILAILGPLQLLSKSLKGVGKDVGESAGKGVGGFMNALGGIEVGKALKGALAIAAVGGALALGIAAISWAMQDFPPGRAVELGITIAGIVAASYLLVPLGQVGPKALIGAIAVGLVGAALAGGIYLLGKAINGMSMGKIKMLGILAGGLAVMTGLLALIGIPVVAGAALLGAATVMGVSVLLAGAIAVLGMVSGSMQNIATGLDILVGALAYLTPEMGQSLTAVGVGLAAFGAALVGGEIAAFFGADIVSQAFQMAEAMSILEPSIASLASMGEGAANAFMMIGQGLALVSESLSGGGVLDFFSGDKVKNARDIAAAMTILARPIESIGMMGETTANAFVKMAAGLRLFMETLKDDAGWFDSFEENADDIAKAMEKLSKPMSGMMGGQVEEIKSALALSINQGNSTNDAILNKLEEIKEAIEENGGVGTGGSSASLDELRKTTAILERMLGEMSMGSSFGTSMADTRYNT